MTLAMRDLNLSNVKGHELKLAMFNSIKLN